MARVVRVNAEAGTVSFALPGVRLDPGAIGKGYALERAADLLREAGVRRALLHGGTSTVCALGDSWKVALQHPKRPGVRLTTVELHDASLSVSAVHGKSFWMQGKEFGHVIDPRSGRPVTDTVLAAVVTASATESDALSTALLVLGAAGIPLLAERFPQAAGYLTAEDEPNTQDGLRIVQRGNIWGSIEC
jgi:FAD:protein FMN transferase